MKTRFQSLLFQILNLCRYAVVLPVSAKEALKAKLAGKSLDPTGFGNLEDYLLSFLGGGGGGGDAGAPGGSRWGGAR